MIEKICIFMAWHLLPNQLVYWCAIRVAAHATTNEYSSQNVTELTALESLKRWETTQQTAA